MARIIKYIGIVIIVSSVIYITPILFFGFLYSHGAGSPGKIKSYEFKTIPKDLRKELKKICDESKQLSYMDTLEDKSTNGYEEILTKIRLVENSKVIVYESKLNGFSDEKNGVFFMLIYINNMSNDDFGWFSWERHRRVKLFEEKIIEPLSKKFERIESN